MTTIARASNFLQMRDLGTTPARGTWEYGNRVPARTEINYFRTYDQVKQAMFALQTKYPDLVRVRDFGDSAEKLAGGADRDLLALEITNTRGGGGAAAARPGTLQIAGIHAREIANPELLMSFANQLLEGYGRDPEATMIVDSRRTVLVPMLNPDGHAVVEKGLAGQPGGNSMQRKSTGGGDPRRGVDLNRNFDFHWGGPGASSSPSNETYRGPSAASEPETKAMQQLMRDARPNVLTDWHSYSELNMWPWGDTRQKAKDAAGFQALGAKFSTFNRYTPKQLVDLYPTTGTTTDYAYGVLGIPAFGIETGKSFLQTDAEFQRTLRDNLPVLAYQSKVADAPFQRVLGPDVTEVRLDAASRAITAVISEATSGKQALAGAELINDPFALPGSGTPLAAVDGAFDSITERVTTSAGYADGGNKLFYVRGRDADGNWGPLTPQWG